MVRFITGYKDNFPVYDTNQEKALPKPTSFKNQNRKTGERIILIKIKSGSSDELKTIKVPVYKFSTQQKKSKFKNINEYIKYSKLKPNKKKK